MKPTYKLILLFIIVLLFGLEPSVRADETTGPNFSNAETVICGDPAETYPRSIAPPNEIDVYSIALVAGQVLTIDVDTEDQGATLDTILEVYFDNDPSDDIYPEVPLAVSEYTSKVPLNEDPYLDLTVDESGTYYLVIYDAIGGATGSYTLSLKCTDPANPPNLPDPVKVGDLLGATGIELGSLLSIIPADGTSTNRFPLGFGPVSDIEFDPVSGVLFAATHAETGSLFAIDPDTGDEIKGVELNSGSIIALEAGEGMLYGVRLEVDPSDNESFKLITIDKENLGITSEVPLSDSLRALAYHPVDKVMYGASGTDLVKINLTSLPGEIQLVGSTGLGQSIVALDFSHDNVLYAVDIPGNLYTIPYLSLDTEQPVNIGTISAVAELPSVPQGPYAAAINGLTFVVGEAPSNEEPIKTICSSSLTSPITAGSETDVPQLSRLNNRLKLKHNPLHRAIGLFKFKGKAGETVTLKLAPEEEESLDASEVYAVSAILEPWLQCKGKGRVFLGIRDAIPHMDFRVRKKAQIPFDMSANLPEDGYYYVMVIRPLLRFYQTDYCLTLESDHPDSEAWQSLDVVWPGDDTAEDTATTSTEAKTAEIQGEEIFDEASLTAEDNTSVETTAVVPTLSGSEPVSAAPDSATVEAADEGSGQAVQALEETAVDDDTGEVAPAEEPTAEATEEPIVKGAPLIPEETSVDDTGEVAEERLTEDSTS
jgi:hypothetical protein